MRIRMMRLLIVSMIVATMVGMVGTAAMGTENQVDFWCDQGVKIEPVDTPFIVPDPPAGTTWTLYVEKAGTENLTLVNPTPGQVIHLSDQDISHVILCYVGVVVTTTTTTTIVETTTTTPEETTTTTDPSTTTTTFVTITTPPPSLAPPTSLPPTINTGDGGYIGGDALGFWDFAVPVFFVTLLAWAFVEWKWAARAEWLR